MAKKPIEQIAEAGAEALTKSGEAAREDHSKRRRC